MWTLHGLAWAGGCAAALGAFHRRSVRGGDRFVLGLWLGVGFAHAGWALVHLPQVAERPGWWLLQPGAVSVLFVPLGVLCLAPWRESLAALPLGFAVARLGCLPYGCCYPSAWGALPELALLAGLHVAAQRWLHLAPLIALCGFGAVRLLSLPFRVPAPPAAWLDPAWIAAAWIAAGIGLQGRIHSAACARTWLVGRAQPALRALAWLLGVWLLYPVSGQLLGASSAARLVAGGVGLALVASTRPPLPWDGARTSVVCVGAGLLAGWLCAGLASTLMAWQGSGSIAAPEIPQVDTALAAGLADPLGWLSSGLAAPALEEMLYRERLLDGLRTLVGARLALLGSSALFALAHADPGALPFALAGGVVCGICRLRTGGLALPIALHAGWNQAGLFLSG